MPYRLNAREYDAVLGLDSASRCAHFIGRVADWQQLWSVRNDEGWLVGTTPDELTYFPVWPHPEYAKTTTDAHFPGHIAGELALTDFLDDWLVRLADDGVQIAVFPDRQWAFHVVDPATLGAHLAAEAARYE